jgi:hypothetical protein
MLQLMASMNHDVIIRFRSELRTKLILDCELAKPHKINLLASRMHLSMQKECQIEKEQETSKRIFFTNFVIEFWF